jgi:hypothetical protein
VTIQKNETFGTVKKAGGAYGYGDYTAAKYDLANNIFFAAAGNGLLTTGGGIVYRNNLYAGSSIQVPAGDMAAIKADPLLAAPGTGQNGGATGPAWTSLDGYKLGSSSPAIAAGLTIPNNGGLDFWGTTLAGTPDIGANEFR